MKGYIVQNEEDVDQILPDDRVDKLHSLMRGRDLYKQRFNIWFNYLVMR